MIDTIVQIEKAMKQLKIAHDLINDLQLKYMYDGDFSEDERLNVKIHVENALDELLVLRPNKQ